MLKYNYALDNQGNVISIVDVPEEGHLEKEFFCIGCGGPMVAAIGPKRRYFRHKADETNCNQESYLHKLAKFRIKQRFEDFSKPFEIQFHGIKECEGHCKFFEEHRCSFEDDLSPLDLHKFYDTCEIEKGIDGFVADLLLSHSKYPSRKPVLIEVYVKHRCTEEKINSGNKIIEVSVDSEETLEHLFSEPWKDCKNTRFNRSEASVTSQYFYGFSPLPEKVRIKDNDEYGYRVKRIPRFLLFPSGKFIVKDAFCYKYKEPFLVKSLLQFNIHNHQHEVYLLEIAHYLKRKYEIGLKACSICRYSWTDRFDVRYCNKVEDESIYDGIYASIPEFTALKCPHYELRWLKKLYKSLPPEERLKEEDIEIVVPYKKEGS